MSQKLNKTTIINDPIYGFITIPNGVVFDLINHKCFQRLRRVSQMGLSYMVYPGAHHTRFHHAIGCLHIMQKALKTLKNKGVPISVEEEEAALTAILLHDIGHGPFSHALEYSIILDVTHEQISLQLMQYLNTEFNGSLTLAIKIFKGDYNRPFLHQLVSSQLDMDRTDYLKRDSFYTGVAEGNINTDRIIAMLNVHNEQLVIEEKGIYTVEKFLVARRLMYWQVYLHKTSLAAELQMIATLKRARLMTISGEKIETSEALAYFLGKNNDNQLNEESMAKFTNLDDFDIISSLKLWVKHDDFVLRELSKSLIDRKLFELKIRKKPINAQKLKERKEDFAKSNKLSFEESDYFIYDGQVSNQGYNYTQGGITILQKNGKCLDIVKASDQLSLKVLTKVITKNYICYPKAKG